MARRGRLIKFFTETRVALSQHECDYCDGQIYQGQEYRREVSAYGSQLVPVKRHECPDCTSVGRF
jgi:hypothetical protein